MIVNLPWTNPPLGGNDRGHTRYSPFTRIKGEALVAVKAAKLPRLAGAEITLVLQPKDRRRRDADNLSPTYKACQDALVAAGVLLDDSWVSVPAATCRIVPPVEGEPARMWLDITPLGVRP